MDLTIFMSTFCTTRLISQSNLFRISGGKIKLIKPIIPRNTDLVDILKGTQTSDRQLEMYQLNLAIMYNPKYLSI